MSKTQINAGDQDRLRERIEELTVRADTLRGERQRLGSEQVHAEYRRDMIRRPGHYRSLPYFVEPRLGEAREIYQRLLEITARRQVIDIEVLLVEMDAVRFAIDLNRSEAEEARARGECPWDDRLTGQSMRLERRWDELDAAIRKATGGQLDACRITWPKLADGSAGHPLRSIDQCDAVYAAAERRELERVQGGDG